MAHRGKRNRAGRKDRKANLLRGQLSAVRQADMNKYRDRSSIIGGVEGAAKFHHEALVSETIEEHIIPRQSITKKQLLTAFPIHSDRIVEVQGKQLLKVEDGRGNLIPVFDDKGNPVMVSFTEKRTIKGDRPVDSLLIKGNPFPTVDRQVKRQGHYDKKIDYSFDKDIERPVKDNPAQVQTTERKMGCKLT